MEENLSELEESVQSIKSSNVTCNDESIGDIRRLFDFFKPKKTDEGFATTQNI